MPINQADITWDEPEAPKLETAPIVWDGQQQVPQQALVTPQPKAELSMMDRIMQYKQKLGKVISEYTPIMSIPKMVAGFTGEAMQKEGSQVAQAQSVKSRLENVAFSYSDLADTVKAATGDKTSAQVIKTKQNKLNEEVAGILKDRGIEAYNDNGKLLVVQKDKKGNDTLVDLNENVLDSVLGGFTSGAGEIGGAVMGAAGGAAQAQRILPPTATPQQRALAGTVGAGIGGYTGAAAGRATDLIRNAISLNKEIEAKEVVKKSLEAGAADVIGTGVIAAAGKGISKIAEPLKKVGGRIKTLMKEGDISGATKQVKADYGVSDKDIDKLFENVKKDVVGFEDLTGDDLQRAKLLAVVQQQPTGAAPIIQAIRQNAKAAIETSKEIDSRAKQVAQAVDTFAKKPSTIKRSIEAYEKVVGKNYGEVKGLINEALPNYKPDIDLTTFKDTLDEINTRVIDPTVKDKVTNLAESLASQKTESVDDLINVRQLFNKFYGKNSAHFENAADKKALMSIQKTIDSKIDEALETLPGNTGKQLKAAFTDAKQKYADMFKTQDTATYNAIFKKGASEDDIGRSLVKYSKAADGDLEGVLSKLSPVQRTKAEFGVLKQMINMAGTKEEAKAIDFGQLLDEVGTSREVFKTPQAQQFLRNIEGFNKKFGKDVDLQAIAMDIAPRVKKNIATDIIGKGKMEMASRSFEALQRLIPSETGRRLSLQKSIESALENSRTANEFFFKASKIKGLPNADREALKKTVKEISEVAERIKRQTEK